MACAHQFDKAITKRCPFCNRLWRRAYRLRHPDVRQSEQKRYRAKNRQYFSTIRKQRQDWLNSGDVTAAELRVIYANSKGLCRYCKVPVKVRCFPSNPGGFDHVIPCSKGGRHTAANIVVCCPPCNRKKYNKIKGEAANV